MKKQFFYFSGTHWDREWYQNYQGFRLRLVRALDDMIAYLEQHPEFKVFHLDGQTIVLEDYLEIRPEMESRLKKLIQEQRILIGPWYCMPDEFLVSGEALIRNLLKGKELCGEFGTESWQVGYICDIFGHTAQLPQILNSFHMAGTVLGRGTNEHTTPSFFQWVSPDGSAITAYKIPDTFGYGSYALTALGQLARKEEAAVTDDKFLSGTKSYLSHEENRTPLPFGVIMDAMDHEPLHPKTPEYIAKIEELYPDYSIRHENLEHLFRELEEYRDTMPVKTGELYESGKGYYGGFIHVLTHVLSSHPSIKRRNDHCQTLLEKWLEPLYIYSAMQQLSYPQTFLSTAWKWLLQNHPHDSICGCSADRVHQDMAYRFSQAESITEAIWEDMKRTLAKGYKRCSTKDNELYILNPTLYEQETSITCTIPFVPDYPKYQEPFGYQPIAAFHITDSYGQEIPYAITGIETAATVLPQGEQTLPADLYTVVFRSRLNAFGCTKFNIVPSQTPVRYFGGLSSRNVLDNQKLRITVNEDGTIHMYDYQTQKTYPDLLGLLDDAEIGDGWHSVRPAGTHIISKSTVVTIKEVLRNPVYSELEIVRQLLLPENTERNQNGICRSAHCSPFLIHQTLRLYQGERKLHVSLSYDNQMKDHRLRLVLPVDNRCDFYEANQAFTFVKRTAGRNTATADWKEPDQLEKPMHGIILSREQDQTGIAFVGKYGFYECAMEDAVQKALMITCHRGFGKVYYEDHLNGGQELGVHNLSFLLIPLDNTVSNTQLQIEQDIFKTGIESFIGNSFKETKGIQLNGTVAVSCIKPAADGSMDTIIRIYNPGNKDEPYHLSLDRIYDIYLCTMEETIENAAFVGNTASLDGLLEHQKIQTIRLHKNCR